MSDRIPVGIPPRYRAAWASGDVRRTPAMDQAEQHLGPGLDTLVLAGLLGVGKTWAACRLLSQADAKSRAFVRAPDLDVLARWSDQVLEIATIGALVIDDLGSEREVPIADSLVGRIIERRADYGGRTIVTTNLGPKRFSDRYGARLVDRVNGAGAYVWIASDKLRGAHSLVSALPAILRERRAEPVPDELPPEDPTQETELAARLASIVRGPNA